MPRSGKMLAARRAAMKRFVRLALFALALALPFVLLRIEATRSLLTALMAFMRDGGPAGIVAFFAVEAVGGVLIFPIWLMAGIAGYVFGFAKGAALAIPGVTLAASTSFLVGRFLASGLVGASAKESVYFRAVSRVADREGLKVTLLLRVTPVVPQNLLGYLMSATPVRMSHFVLGTLVGLAPVTAVQTYAGSMVQSAAALIAGEAQIGGPMRWVALVGALVLCVVGIGFVMRMARRALAESLAQGEQAGPS